MVDAQEWKIRLQFLDEARDYLNEIESEVIGMSDRGLQRQSIDKVLRAAHSVKGGAAMMGFESLSEIAHRLEDSFKVLRVGKTELITGEVEGLFLKALDTMGQVAVKNKQQIAIEPIWLEENALPTFARLQELLGELSAQDETAALSAEVGQDMRLLMFETEVDACLQRLEGVIADPDTKVLREEFAIASQELGCLGEILDLPPFVSLCNEITETLEANTHDLHEVAVAALDIWRRSQALVLVSQFALLPSQFFISPLSDRTLIEAEKTEVEKSEVEKLEVKQSENLAIPNQAEKIEVPSPQLAPQLPTEPTTIGDDSDEATVRIPVRYLKTLTNQIGGLNAERSSMRLQLQRMRDLVQLFGLRVNGLEQSNTQLRETYDRVATSYEPLVAVSERDRLRSFRSSESEDSSSFANRFDLLEMDRYSEMHLLSREIMDSIVQLQEVFGDIDTALSDTEGTERELGRAAVQLQKAIAQVRMRLLDDVLSRFPRMLRELSLAHGKQVELFVRGSSTLVERSILEVLEAPLLHLVRNAFDHGIEDPDTRVKRGKPPKGKIEIAAGYRGNQIVITIGDDGGGIDLTKVRAKALEMGLSQTEVDRASDSDLFDLIFEPGFSTADRVTTLSGRGVGMDIVRSNLRSIGGNVIVESVLGKGTVFVLTIPMSLSIARVLLVESSGLMMAIPTSAIEEMLLLRSLEITPNPQTMNGKTQEVFDWEGYAVPLLRLRDRLNFARPQQQIDSIIEPIIDEPLALVTAPNNIPFAFQVDRYWGEQEVTTRTVQGHLPLPEGFSGCAILGGGRIVPLLDLDKLLEWSFSTDAVPRQTQSLFFGKRDRRTTVMVVDDSINVRRFLAMTLEKAGFRVEQAKDGQEAIEKLLAGTNVRAVVCDIEMPRLDGFGFLAQSRAHDASKDIPVIMLTSRSGAKHRDLAMRLGASGYFSKPFKEQDLLRTLSQLTISVSSSSSSQS
ncbi:hybrid sensor histidine kinase/response regulator [Tumidithrix elongata RA019]|uniref:histidine kinase n=1 Tax=Tumidithrix elongata BACA0141 TaxID=2716417 RepID=A0AAW9Q1Z9_9CYAN|nr:hybrid sensor histidine kinase/response regulator [Tumidithrix elongata RA019]